MLEFAFEGRENSLMSWGKLIPIWGLKCEKCEAMDFAIEMSDKEPREREGQ